MNGLRAEASLIRLWVMNGGGSVLIGPKLPSLIGLNSRFWSLNKFNFYYFNLMNFNFYSF